MDRIRSSLLFKSKKGNRYIYDRNLKRQHPCHPLLYHIIATAESGEDPGNWLQSLAEKHAGSPGAVPIDGAGTYPLTKIRYYYNKYLLLKKNGYFNEIDHKEYLSGRFTPEMVEDAIANAPNLVFEVTERCNLLCKYCGYGELYDQTRGSHDKDLDMDTAKKALDYFIEKWNSPMNRAHDGELFIGFYGGEPLMKVSLIKEIIRYVNRHEFPRNRVGFNMTTNALLLDKHMDFLVENNFRLLISLDGNEANNAYRVTTSGKPSFPTVFKNIKALKEKHPDYFRRQVNINAVLHNKNSAQDIYGFIKKELDKIPRIAELNQTGIKDSKQGDFRETYRNREESLKQTEDYGLMKKDMFSSLPDVQTAVFYMQNTNEFIFNHFNDALSSRAAKRRVPTGTCIPFTRRIFVTATGKILPCERISHDFILGSVTPEGVQLDSAQIAERYNQWFERIAKRCASCYRSADCTQCFFYLDQAAGDGVPPCQGWMSRENFSQSAAGIADLFERDPKMYGKVINLDRGARDE